jgi:hypothetical protein
MKIFATLILAITAVSGQSQDDLGDDAATSGKASSQLRRLYQVLHDIALPSADVGLENTVEQRLVLLLPGKILSYDDYYPGGPYVDSLKSQDPNARFVDIPPRIMENMFRLSDIVPGINPFNGFESGESLSALYREIVGSLDIVGFEKLSEDKKKRFKESVEYLIQKVQDPEPKFNCQSGNEIQPECKEITRLSLYRRYQQRYNEEKEMLETEVEDRRQNLTSLQYQLWFTRTYPSLQAKVDGALLDWLVFGDKDNVELYRSRLDTSSPGTVLLEAKSALRSSEFSSLDRSQKIYPVTFVPGDWYQYINNIPIRMSRDQLQNKIGDLEAQQLMIQQSIASASCSLGDSETAANSSDSNITNALIALVEETNTLKCECVKETYESPDKARSELEHCMEYEEKLLEVQNAAEEKGISLSQVLKLQSIANSNDTANAQEVLDRIEAELTELRTQLPFAPGSTPDIAGFADVPVDPNDKWLTFSYNSKQSQQNSQTSNSEATYSSYSQSYRQSHSYGWWWWWSYRYGGSSSSSTRSTSSSSSSSRSFKSITESEITVKGRVLRVTVQRPWFKPELFKNKRFTIVNSQFQVSPGPSSEKEFISKASQKIYRLPQYVTGFLLARDVEMEFRGLNQQTTQSIIRSSYQSYSSSSSSSYSGGWGPFSFASSSDYSSSFSSSRRYSASFQASATTSGLKIRIPGSQVIGYYTQVVPKFPIDN